MTPMIITTLAKPGTRVTEGGVVIAFDPQEQQRLAFDKRAELVDLESQIEKKRAEHTAAEAKERTSLVAAENESHAPLRSRRTTSLAVAAEKNADARTEHRQAQAAPGDFRAQTRGRGRRHQDPGNQGIAPPWPEDGGTRPRWPCAPFEGLVVVRRTWRPSVRWSSSGDEVRLRQAILDIAIRPSCRRARINQADAEVVRAGLAATVRLDGFPELSFKGRVDQVTPLAVSGMSSMVRAFVAVVSIEGTHPQLMPDLTASVEIGAPPPAPKGSRP
jgi:hypothetical protein